jgi:hypothetical protein
MQIVKDELESIISASKETALKDGQITTDEAHLLDILHQHIADIESELEEIVNLIDPRLNEDEIRNRVRIVSRDILPKLTQTARDDDIVTSDEAAILSKVLNTIMS